MKFPKHIWEQIKNLSADDLAGALEKDGWIRVKTRGAIRIYRHSDGRRVSIHYHPHMTYGPKLLRALLEDIGWTAADMQRLKLIKRK